MTPYHDGYKKSFRWDMEFRGCTQRIRRHSIRQKIRKYSRNTPCPFCLKGNTPRHQWLASRVSAREIASFFNFYHVSRIYERKLDHGV